MTAKILVADDVPANIKLLEAKLSSEYYDVLTARDGYEAIQVAREKKPDLILLDVMMPGMDGFEACKKLKSDAQTVDIPVVMVTALSDQSDRVKGLEAGADDFLTKPINDMALFARVRSLIRIKSLLSELRLRGATQMQIGGNEGEVVLPDVAGARVLLVDDDPIQAKQMITRLSETYDAHWIENSADAEAQALSKPCDVLLISTLLSDTDGIKLAAHLRSQERLRHVPVVMLVDEDDTPTMLKVLELGFNDYLRVPVDKNEMIARVRTQVRRHRYQEMLRNNFTQTITLANTDALTGLYNRHYLNAHLDNLISRAQTGKRPLSLMIMDIDHFKSVNDKHGHDAGDAVLKQAAGVVRASARSSDLVARFGGEEFVVVMPDTTREAAHETAERLRAEIEAASFNLPDGNVLRKTISIGVSVLKTEERDTGDSLIKRADEAMYKAKNGGRNRVVLAE